MSWKEARPLGTNQQPDLWESGYRSDQAAALATRRVRVTKLWPNLDHVNPVHYAARRLLDRGRRLELDRRRVRIRRALRSNASQLMPFSFSAAGKTSPSSSFTWCWMSSFNTWNLASNVGPNVRRPSSFSKMWTR